MAYTLDFDAVSTVGLESSPVAAALVGLRAHEAGFASRKSKLAGTIGGSYFALENDH